jgi:hypothetical protein
MQYRAFARVAGVAVIAAVVSAWAYASGDRVAESAPPAAGVAAGVAAAHTVTVFKDPNCGCCKEWVTHLRKHAFEVVSKDTADVATIKATARVPRQLYSCHTAFVNGYVVEGHVPAADIQRMLAEKPKIAGIAVAGMPAGSPGMEVPGRKDAYQVIAFGRDGSTSVFARH